MVVRYNRAGWLSSAPQASLEYYNPLVMSKLRLTRDAARWNPFHTDAFLWIDGAHNCNDPVSIEPTKMPYVSVGLLPPLPAPPPHHHCAFLCPLH